MRQLSDIVFRQDPLVLHRSVSVKKACEEMHARRTGSAIVTDHGGVLVGIFTGRDAVGRVLAAGRIAEETTLAEVMTSKPRTMSPHDTAIEALRLMWDGGFRHIPVVDSGRVIGVISRGDLTGDEQNCLDEERALWEQMR